VTRITVNGIGLNYRVTGCGEPVVMVMGTGASGRVWDLHQVPALAAAGYQVITFENRGIPPSDLGRPDFTIDDMVEDTAGLIAALCQTACRIVGFSFGAFIVQELLLKHPELVRQGVLIATRGRDDVFRAALSAADRELHDSGLALPLVYRAVASLTRNLSRASLNDERTARDWLDTMETAGADPPGLRRQLDLDQMPSRLDAYRGIAVPTLVIGFSEDLLCPPKLAREVADAIPEGVYQEISDCGHYGYLERPAEVNSCMLRFFAGE
jgi:pimeloyl-ACP methyl ester carboxylesterase